MLLDKTRTVKIADFGVARVEASNPNDMTGETGTLGYMAPEVSSQYLNNPLQIRYYCTSMCDTLEALVQRQAVYQ